MSKYRDALITSVAMGGLAVALFFAGNAAAAEAGENAAAAASAVGQAVAAQPAAAADTIVVTGSRIKRREVDSIAPTQVLDSKYLDTRGFSTVAEALNELPSFGVPGSSPIGFGQSQFGAGQSFVNFLGLGSQRTLTLVNGRRFVSSNTNTIFGPTGTGGNQVDLNTIPTKLIDRVETVVAIGAPIYGSDAIAGTINIILKKNFDGFDLDGNYGISDRGDAQDWRIRALAGKNFAGGRGNIILAAEYNSSKGLFFRDRQTTSSDDRFDNPVTPGQYAQVPYRDYRVPSISLTGLPLVGDFIATSPQQSAVFGFPGQTFGVTNGSGQTLRFAKDGSLEPLDFGQQIGPSSGFSLFTSGGNGYSLRDVENLLTDIERYNVNAIVNFDLTPNLHLFGEAWYASSEGRNLASQPTYQYAFFGSAGQPDGNLKIPLSNPFLSPAARSTIQNAIATNPLADSPTQDYFYLARGNFDLTPGVAKSQVELSRFVFGVDGKVQVLPGKDWNFELSVNYGQAITHSYIPDLVEANFLNALNATKDASGNIVCAPGSTNSPIPTLSPTCAPLNPFGNQISNAARNYVTTIATPRNRNEQIDFIASIAGPIFRLPGGDGSYALGYEHRQETSAFQPGNFYFGAVDPSNPTGARTSYGRSVPIDPVFGKFITNEVFGEFNGDVIAPRNHIPFIYSLSYQTAARYIWNSQAGKDLTWTAGGKYAPTNFLSFRAAYTRAVRAPSATEAFNPTSSAFFFANDPCDASQLTNGPDPAARQKNCAAAGLPVNFASLSNQRSFRGFNFGNPNLQNEKSDNITAGIVFTPKTLRGFEATVDYVDITINNSISQFSATQVVDACYDSVNYPSNPFCGLVQRDANGQLSQVSTSYFNSAKLKYKGILANIHYRHPSPLLGAASNITVGLSYQYLDTLTNEVTQGAAPTINDNSVGYSRHKAVLTMDYDNGPFFFQTQVQYIGSAKIDPNAPANFYSIPDIKEVAFVNLSASYKITKRLELHGNVDNLFDTKPPSPFPLYGNSDGQNVYFTGILGRYYRVGATVHF